MSTKFEKVPGFLLPGTTAADIVKARKKLDVQRNTNPSFDLTMPYRRSAFAARIASAMPLTVDQFVEFEAAVPEGYKVRLFPLAQAVQAAQIQADGRAKWQAEQAERKAREAAQPPEPKTLREALARWPFGGIAYNSWVDRHQHLLANGDFLD